MGARGPGASRMKKAAEALRNESESFPWQAKGLTRAERMIAFIEALPITKGYGAGEPVKLLPFQREWLEAIYATDDDGNRLVRTGLLSVARGQGKTVLAAMLCLAHLVGPEAEPRGECYSAGATKEQASLIFAEMEAIILAVPWLAAHCNVKRFHKTIEVPETGAIYRALASDGKAVHGTASSFVVCDELAQWKRRELYDVLRTSMGKRKEPLLLAIGTQSPRAENIMSELCDYAGKVNSGEIEDKGFHGAVYEVPPDHDPYDPESWLLANPAIDHFVSREQIAAEAEKAQRIPSYAPAFLNLHCNQRVDAEPKAINPAEWEACGKAFDPEALKGRPCYAGLDLASVRDLAALVLYFPQDDGAVIPFFWTPKKGLAAKEELDRVPYRAWEDQGYLETTPGAAIDKEFIAQRLGEIAGDYDLQGVAYDRQFVKDLQVILNREGVTLPLVEWGQGFVSMAPAVNAFEEKLLKRELSHAMHPVLTWNASNAIFEYDAAANRKLSKSRSIDRIDGLQALVMALGLAARDEPERGYEGAGPMWLDA